MIYYLEKKGFVWVSGRGVGFFWMFEGLLCERLDFIFWVLRELGLMGRSKKVLDFNLM